MSYCGVQCENMKYPLHEHGDMCILKGRIKEWSLWRSFMQTDFSEISLKYVYLIYTVDGSLGGLQGLKQKGGANTVTHKTCNQWLVIMMAVYITYRIRQHACQN